MAIAFTCSRDLLRPLVEQVAKVVAKRNTIPILANVALRAEDDGRLSVMGTDLDIWAIASAGGAEVESAGATTVPAALLAEILRKGEGDIRFTENDKGQALLVSGRSRFRLNALPVEDLPTPPETKPAAEFDLEPKLLTAIVDSLAFAISTEETRYYLNGVYLHPVEGGIATVATDGHRLSRLHLELDGIPDFAGIIVPRKIVGLFGLIAASCDAEESVAVALDDSRISFETHGLRLVSKLIDGTFPDYNRVIPSGNDKRATLPREAMAKAVERVSAISTERGRAVRLDFAAAELVLTVQSPDAGEATDGVDCTFDGEEPLTMGFNARYLLDLLATFAGDKVVFALEGPGSPALITDPGDDQRTVVLMPMRV